jgi:hypothetical protein
MGTRKSSGTIIVPREHPRVELKEGDEVFDADDARAMSPRRSSQDLEKMGQEARAQLNEYVFLPPTCDQNTEPSLSSSLPRSIEIPLSYIYLASLPKYPLSVIFFRRPA